MSSRTLSPHAPALALRSGGESLPAVHMSVAYALLEKGVPNEGVDWPSSAQTSLPYHSPSTNETGALFPSLNFTPSWNVMEREMCVISQLRSSCHLLLHQQPGCESMHMQPLGPKAYPPVRVKHSGVLLGLWVLTFCVSVVLWFFLDLFPSRWRSFSLLRLLASRARCWNLCSPSISLFFGPAFSITAVPVPVGDQEAEAIASTNYAVFADAAHISGQLWLHGPEHSSGPRNVKASNAAMMLSATWQAESCNLTGLRCPPS